jgi:hypothetical protein
MIFMTIVSSNHGESIYNIVLNITKIGDRSTLIGTITKYWAVDNRW